MVANPLQAVGEAAGEAAPTGAGEGVAAAGNALQPHKARVSDAAAKVPAAASNAGSTLRSAVDPLVATHSQRVVVMCTVGTGLMTGIASVHRGDGLPPARVVGGVVVTGIALSALAEFQPRLAAGIAAIMLLTATIGMGSDAAGGVNDLVRKRKPAPKRPAGGGGGSPKRPA